MSKNQSTLLEQVERYMAANRMSARRFGIDAMGDPNFVLDLRKINRRVWPETEDHVMRYIASGGRENAETRRRARQEKAA